MKRFSQYILPYCISAACMCYVLWDLDYSSFLDSFSSLSILPLLFAQIASICAHLTMAQRIVCLSSKDISYATGFYATMIGAALNNLFPAKLGEGAKVIVLHANGKLPLKDALAIAVWERFCDLNMVIAVGLAAAMHIGSPAIILPLFSIIAIIWAVLTLFNCRPELIDKFTAYIPGHKFSHHLREQILLLTAKIQWRVLTPTTLYTLLTWTLGFAFYFLALGHGSGLQLTTLQVFVAFSASVLARAIPAAPGSLGVYESYVVAVLVLFGVSKEQALAMAVTLHGIQLFLPTLIGASLIPRFAGGFMSLVKRTTKTIRK